MIIKCEICQVSFTPHSKKGRVCSLSCRGKLGRSYQKVPSNFKGDAAGYSAIHKWLAYNFKKTGVCEDCGKSGLRGKKIQWANLSGEYRRDRADYKELCNRCHYHLDRTLSREDVITIRREYKGRGQGITQDKLAGRFGVSRSHISGVIHGKFWKECA